MHAKASINRQEQKKDNHVSDGIRNLTLAQIQRLRKFIHKKVMNPDDADDILQSTFVEALRNEHKFQNASKPETWLCGIALNLIRNHFRRLYNQPYLECWNEQSIIENNQHHDYHDVAKIIDDRRQLQRTVVAVKGLPVNMQQVIQVSVMMEGNYQDTAQSLGVPIGTVRSRLSRAREQLRQTINPFA